RLRFEVEMVLPADAEGAFEDVFGRGERRRHVAAADVPRRAAEVLLGDGVVKGQHGRQRLQLDPHRLLGRLQGTPGFGGDGHDRLADVAAFLGDQHFFVVEDRAERVVAGYVPIGEDRDNAFDLRGGAYVECRDTGVGDGAADEIDEQLALDGRQVVEVDG